MDCLSLSSGRRCSTGLACFGEGGTYCLCIFNHMHMSPCVCRTVATCICLKPAPACYIYDQLGAWRYTSVSDILEFFGTHRLLLSTLRLGPHYRLVMVSPNGEQMRAAIATVQASPALNAGICGIWPLLTGPWSIHG